MRPSCHAILLVLPLVASAADATEPAPFLLPLNEPPSAVIRLAGPPPGAGDTLFFMHAELGAPATAIAGRPYSAEVTVENRQSLADGNEIVLTHVSRVYRDQLGRTRRDEQLGPPEAQRQHIFINDPVAGHSYVLDPAQQRAHELPPGLPFARGAAGMPRGPAPGPAFAGAQFERAVPAPGGSPLPAPVMLPFPGAEHSEDLGQREIEGLRVQGTRSVAVIPAGAIGNLRPIEVINEQWISPDLDLVVDSVRRDPRFGEMHYSVSNIMRSEPDPSLFELPPGYEVVGPQARWTDREDLESHREHREHREK